MVIIYKKGEKEEKVTFEKISMASWTGGALSRLENLWFSEWVKLIDEIRFGKLSQKQPSSLDELEKLAQLKEKGIITEEEFKKKKSKLLSL